MNSRVRNCLLEKTTFLLLALAMITGAEVVSAQCMSESCVCETMVSSCEGCCLCSQPACGCHADIWSRDKLTGNWHGKRDCLAEHGITVAADSTLFYMGVVDGGLAREARFAGHNDYVINTDMGKLGIQEGLFLKLRAEHRYGESLAGATGALLPSNVLADLPVSDSEEVYLTNVLFTQMLSERVGLFFGKLDTLDGDLNAFAHGRGKRQFSNMAFVSSVIALRTVPYSTLGAGLVVLGEEGTPVFSFSVLNSTDTATTSGFDELFANGVTLNAELRLPTHFFQKPGHQLLGGTWSSRDYVALSQDPRIVLPNVPINRQQGSWSVYWNFDQYLFEDPCHPGHGWGVFGRAGIADGASNPIQSFLSFGVGGHSTLRGRENDTFGMGWYYSETSNQLGPALNLALGGLGDGQGVEMYYDMEVTPWFHLTPDLQVIMPAREAVDTATVLGLRGRIIY